MKTSNKLLVVVVILMIGFLIANNFVLKAEYFKGYYKSPYYQMENLQLADFDAIDLDPAGWTDLTINKGPKFGVWVTKETKSILTFKSSNHKLSIAYKKNIADFGIYRISITCPDLKSFIAKPKGSQFAYTDAANITINGFKEDTMTLQTARASTVQLLGSAIGCLNAGSDTTGGKLIIVVGNHIREANFNMQGPGELRLYEPVGDEKRSFKLSSAAVFSLSNDALKLFPH